MLSGSIGNKPTTTKKSLRHHATVVPHVEALQVSERQQRGLKRQGLDIDALNVVNIAVIYRAPSTKKRSTGTFVGEGKNAKADKVRAKNERAEEKARAKAEKAKAKED
ncbi:hypothetical protein PC119_g328 [Phytophthora cactorum]|uniref:Uncharacterized protein n=1 Tax=Phytophthora cactorum TaxID=29920 RepID=A0A8T1EV69_9STRA|nr:hypothetical protein PC114_g835 [Phytophthora cactorum]KAG2955902.1 hypothetical protein PC117_g105 [Phytophthora cactorum]KAG3042211.1 hypothetical protein PC119_g328 [Phytophthora cactorum]